ncbi:pyruvate dehydrogenase E1 alpha subunit [Cavenderia fasciculata]|uniref:Pyruvate dehydrogenase E1 component subunit alpha n=1 Tax=Cavenderia fasciculata TaxID=261658 RepID=F4Q9H1_CACFS|nr:pyruvate dehydrogenase E1 alpha subunit [Cavenderia fasciculata]EGG15340.1 pyruvate dehydrogenase E1 alpha subunit [Cavenderia fasciculata]|eukprot:XP_004354082.1 pyruvate dehydrogenase E1 alpha subunit [Cavenderia fasciculata]
MNSSTYCKGTGHSSSKQDFLRGYASKSGDIQVKFNKFDTYLCDGPANQTTTNKDELMTFFTDMTKMRRIETVADQLYKKKLIRGFCHLYNGQEAVCTGMEAAITKEDHVITAYRDHTFMMARGATPKEILAELLMKSTGCSKGKGGSMHMFTRNFYGGNGIVGAQCPLGAGIAFTQKYNNTGNVCLTYYGDGAANQGQLFEAFNMAKLWDLPCIFICENNKFGMGTPQKRAAAGDDFYTRAHYIPGIKVDGMNVLAVKTAGKWAADWCRAGKGPLVMEMDTYRYVGHSMSDPGTSYRTREEVNNVRQIRDPIEYVRKLILDNKCATEDELTAIEDAARVEMDEAAEFAIASPFPEPGELYTNVYKELVPVRAVEMTDTLIVVVNQQGNKQQQQQIKDIILFGGMFIIFILLICLFGPLKNVQHHRSNITAAEQQQQQLR